MQLKILWGILFLLLGSLQTFAQNFEQYSPLTCQGEIPDIFITPSSEKYKAEIESLQASNISLNVQNGLDQFTLEANFLIDDMMQSGVVLFNDEVSSYLNEIAQVLTANNKELQKKVQVYTLRSESINAFATDRGSVFVTLGLISQLENEAQLAYVLAHELTHVNEKHSINIYLQTNTGGRSKDGTDWLEDANLDQGLLSENHYSKEAEIEADSLGFKRLLSTNYSFSSLDKVFDVFKYAYLPYDEVVFDHQIFEDSNYIFPHFLKLDTVQAISGEDEFADDSESTHPNIGTRRLLLQRLLENKSNEGRQNYLVSEERFQHVREIARFELPFLHLQSESFPEAIYTANLLLQKYPDNLYLKKTIGKALYIEAKYSNDADYFYDGNYKDIEGEIQQVYYLLQKISTSEITILALKYNWEILQKTPDDLELNLIVEDLFTEFGSKSYSLEKFKDIPLVIEPEEEEEEEAIIEEQVDENDELDPEWNSSSSSSIKKKRKKKRTDYWEYAFVDYIKDQQFIDSLDAGKVRADDRKDELNYRLSPQGQSDRRAYQKRLKKKGLSLGIDKIVVINPIYLKSDRKLSGGIEHLESEITQERFYNYFEEFDTSLPIELEMLDIVHLKKEETTVFNNIRFLNDWFDQQLTHDDLSLTPGYNQEELNRIADEYGTDYFLWTGVFTFKRKKQSFLYGLLFDIRTGKRQVIKFEFMNKRDRDFLIRGHVYDMLFQIGG